MPNPFFRFKQFTIRQENAAMKVGTDGVLLGAWAEVSGAKTVLDIGTGTGLIAIMLAQRSQAKIDAVEIDEASFIQAKENVTRCPWSSRIALYHNSFQGFSSERDVNYDLIVSNPPYFITFDGDTFDYDKLLIASGGTPEKIEVEGADVGNIKKRIGNKNITIVNIESIASIKYPLHHG